MRRQTMLTAGILAVLINSGLIEMTKADNTPPVQGCAAAMPNGFDWPADPLFLYKISGGLKTQNASIPGSIDTVAQRRHGWLLFAGITQLTANKLPVFHTWYTVEETFDTSAGNISCAERRALLRLSLPTQLVMEISSTTREKMRGAGLVPSPRFDLDPAFLRGVTTNALEQATHDGVVAFSHVAFNQDMYDYIRKNKYYSKDTLNATIDPQAARTPIVDPPKTAISLKFSWWPAAPDQLTAVPVWDNDPRVPGDAKNPPTNWKRVVAVDPVGGLQSPANMKLGGFDHPNPDVVPLNRFYNVKITAEEADLANADFRIKAAATAVLGRPLKEGDFLLMTAMHIATREFDPWVFLTYWWTDKPNIGPLASDMPSDVKDPFRNYLMDVSYNINAPEGADGKAPISYNPWLELFQLGGTSLAMHGLSRESSLWA